MQRERLTIVGRVQGVGFRPAVARLARALDLGGWVRNDGKGVEVLLEGSQHQRDAFVERLLADLPRLARIDRLSRTDAADEPSCTSFEIASSHASKPSSVVTADATTCAACLAEITDPYERRYRYPFASCADCGPRYSIVKAIPYDRDNTTMRAFEMCSDCRTEYDDEDDRRYHAQPIACYACGPQAELLRTDGRAFGFEAFSMLDPVDAVGTLLLQGHIVALKGIGGYQLCCDATNEEVVTELRRRKRRPDKPLALMARDLDVIRRHAIVREDEAETLQSPAGPIVLLDVDPDGEAVADSVAPGQTTLGFMLPTTGLHHLVLKRVRRPIVCTSGNFSDDPQLIDDAEAFEKLGTIADWVLRHDRPIEHRVDDSVVRSMGGEMRILRRARGYAPDVTPLPPGFERTPAVLAVGGQYKATFALLAEGRVVLSPHIGELDALATFESWQRSVQSLTALYQHEPERIAVDKHAAYRSAELGRSWAEQSEVQLVEVAHHHAHIAACMADNGRRLDAEPVLGVAFDGLGMGEADELWGGEFLIADYRGFARYGTLRPIALLGGDAASRQPWRNLYAHLVTALGWGELELNHGDTELVAFLRSKPKATLDAMLADGSHAPLASSCGRLFDAVAAALGLCREEITFEGQAAMALEALVTPEALAQAQNSERYPIAIPLLPDSDLPYVEFLGMWRAVLGDIWAETPPELIAARFHVALADAVLMMANRAHRAGAFGGTVALSGGVWQNRVLLELTTTALTAAGFEVLTHRTVPPNDGCIALGQAVIAAAIA